MDKYSFFVAACKAQAFLRKAWTLNAFSVVYLKPEQAEAYDVVRDKEGNLSFLNPTTNALEPIEGNYKGTPLFAFKEKCRAKPGDALNLTEALDTTYGRLFWNWMVLCWPFGNKVPYQNDAPVNVKAVEAIIESKLVDNPDDLSTATDQNVIYVFEYEKFLDANFNGLTGYTQLCVPSASKKTMTQPPEILKLREKLLTENKDRLHDPAVIAKIQKELAAADMAYMKGDPGMGFMINPKSFDTIRMKMFLMQGAEMGFSGPEGLELIPTSLAEGMDVTKMPAIINGIRSGSYDRGADTALGGAEVKTFYRLFQNAKITIDDCGSPLGLPKLVTPVNIKKLKGYYFINAGKAKPIDESCLGKIVQVRSPGYCKADGTDYCKVCMGDVNAQYPSGLPSGASDVGNQFMYMFMKAMHGKALKTANYDFLRQIK